MIGVSIGVVALVFAGGVIYFRMMERTLADLI
jgi:hypothetical protein